MKIEIHKSTHSGKYESFIGLIGDIPFRIGRNLDKNNLFHEDLKGNLTTKQMVIVFEEIDNLRKAKLLL